MNVTDDAGGPWGPAGAAHQEGEKHGGHEAANG